MPSFNKRHTLTKAQRNEKSARKKRHPGGKMQVPGTKPYEHRLPEKAAFVPIETPESAQRAVDAEIASMMSRKVATTPDIRCPKCDSSRMHKEGTKTCPECGYGNPYYCTKCERAHKSGKVYDEHWEFKGALIVQDS